MYSNIFQVSKNPIDEKDYITIDDYAEHWLIGEIADFVDNSDNPLSDILELNDVCGLVVNQGRDVQKWCFTVTSKEQYFKPRYKAFAEALDALQANLTMERFCGIDDILWILQSIYENKYDIYISEGENFCTLDYFVRNCDINTKYYIGGVLKYHF